MIECPAQNVTRSFILKIMTFRLNVPPRTVVSATYEQRCAYKVENKFLIDIDTRLLRHMFLKRVLIIYLY